MLVGHSMGGWLAQIYAALFPDKVDDDGRVDGGDGGLNSDRMNFWKNSDLPLTPPPSF